ncbi:MAG: co-chaperone protein DjlA [Pseudohongiella sp.]|nr:MAG: co-chaperone protein DjlA [Pseudohongiella sp.]
MLTALTSKAYRKALFKRLSGFSATQEIPAGGRAEQLLVRAMFMVLGRLAKMDGRVTQEEIDYADRIMQRMALQGERRREAIAAYDQGKFPDSQLCESVAQAAKILGRRSALAKLFLQIQCEAAYLKGMLRLKDKMLLRDVAELMGYTKSEFLAIAAATQSEQFQRPQGQARGEFFKPQGRSFLQNAYRVLQLEPGVEDGEIRRAYLRMMSRYHPDKLASGNASEDALRQAQENAMAIRSAYEALCGFRKLRA